ncbi:MAG: tRNA (guanosine(46)-N7)-methyltransferase TrmB [Bacilli bacterium]
MRLKSKPWAKPLIAEHPEYVQPDTAEITTHADFKSYALEIGTGKGDFIFGKSQGDPSTFFYGIERVTTVLAFALKKILPLTPHNVKLILGDFAKASFQMQDGFFSEIYLNFSDPWPKLRHHKRRLTAPGNLEKINRILASKGMIYLKTDNLELFQYSLENLKRMPYNMIRVDAPYVEVEPKDVTTEYEAFFRNQGQPIYRFIAQKE